jgi:hypothetical protein
LQFRAFYIIHNIVKASRELAVRIVETELMDILFAMKEIKDDQLVNDKVRRFPARSAYRNAVCFVVESQNRVEYRSSLFEVRTDPEEPRSNDSRGRRDGLNERTCIDFLKFPNKMIDVARHSLGNPFAVVHCSWPNENDRRVNAIQLRQE